MKFKKIFFIQFRYHVSQPTTYDTAHFMQWAKEKFREELAGRLTAQVCQKKMNSSMKIKNSLSHVFAWPKTDLGLVLDVRAQ